MARSDLVLSLVTAAKQGDQLLLRKSVEALIAEERAQNHNVFAERLEEVLRRNGATPLDLSNASARSDAGLLVSEVTPRRALESLVLSEPLREVLRDIIEEHQRADLLKSYNLEPRHRLLFLGPPGNGKTSLAEALAYELMVPLYVARYEGLIGSFLGETAGRVGRLFDWVRSRRCVLFFDEFDVIAKERGDVHETGEIKRVVSSLLLQIDALPAHVVVVTASNHAELLDRASWRRFQARLKLDFPTEKQRLQFLTMLLGRLEQPIGVPIGTVGKELSGLSFAELEDFCVDVMRKHVLRLPESNLKQIVRSTLREWSQRARPSSRTRPAARR